MVSSWCSSPELLHQDEAVREYRDPGSGFTVFRNGFALGANQFQVKHKNEVKGLEPTGN